MRYGHGDVIIALLGANPKLHITIFALSTEFSTTASVPHLFEFPYPSLPAPTCLAPLLLLLQQLLRSFLAQFQGVQGGGSSWESRRGRRGRRGARRGAS